MHYCSIKFGEISDFEASTAEELVKAVALHYADLEEEPPYFNDYGTDSDVCSVDYYLSAPKEEIHQFNKDVAAEWKELRSEQGNDEHYYYGV